ncbi:MAG: VRR-NUC domain-containing protein [Chitinophagaceae bacterium]|nr:MAG: VRR-NUC domain-containing protein [Chitinophagaceae bacterium]
MREQLAEAVEKESLVKIALQLPDPFPNTLMERRRGRLLNQLAYEFERIGEQDIALQLYKQTNLTPSRERQIRLLEKFGDCMEAWLLLTEMLAKPANEHELQIAERMAPRLAKKVGIKMERSRSAVFIEESLSLVQLQNKSGEFLKVEEIVRRHFHSESAPCLYAENELINGLFGLWLWPEMFSDTDGAFANPFQTAPLDLYQEAFQENRPGLPELWKLFDNDTHHTHINNIWKQKNGIANQFVSWHFIDEPILNLALQCIDKEHLKRIFQRLLFDLKANRSGLPDLIQFFPETNTYRMIEVKGPGDRIQDNQQRWLDFFSKNNIPAEVCYVSWE